MNNKFGAGLAFAASTTIIGLYVGLVAENASTKEFSCKLGNREAKVMTAGIIKPGIQLTLTEINGDHLANSVEEAFGSGAALNEQKIRLIDKAEIFCSNALKFNNG